MSKNQKKGSKKREKKTDWSKAASIKVESVPTPEELRDFLKDHDFDEIDNYEIISKKELQELKDQIPRETSSEPSYSVLEDVVPKEKSNIISGFSIVEDDRYGVFVDGDIIKHEKIDVLSCTKYLGNLVFIISNPGRPYEPDTSEVLFTSSEPEERKWHCPIHSPVTDCDHIKTAKAWAIEEDVIRVETIEVPDEA